MIKYLKLSYTYITLVGIISSGLQVLIFYRFWGIVNDRQGAGFTLFASMWFYIIEFFLWVFMTPGSVMILLPLAHIVAAIEAPAFALGSFNRRYEIIPEEGRVIYDSFFSGFVGIAFLVSPMVGGALRDLMAKVSFLERFQYGNFRIIYLFSLILIFLLQLYNYFMFKKHEPDSNCLKKSAYKEALALFKGILFRRL